MRIVFTLLAAAAVLAGCAGAAPKPETPALAGGPLVIDVEGGYFREQDMPLPPQGAVVNAWLSRSNVVNQWAAMQAFCVASTAGERVCLNRVAFDAGLTDIGTSVREYEQRDGEQKLVNEAPVRDGFTHARPARIAISSTPTSVSFRIDGQEPVVYPVSYPVEKLVLFCSSAVCHFEQVE